MAPLTVEIVDQHAHPIPNSKVHVFGIGTHLMGAMVIVPVTEDSDAPPVQGTLSNGYGLRLFPAINGFMQEVFLYRDEPPVELTAVGLHRTMTWEMAIGSLRFVDTTENEVKEASIHSTFFTGTTGMPVSLPVTDEVLYPTLGGTYLSGYMNVQLRTKGSPTWAGPFTFKLRSDKAFSPAFVSMNGTYGLRLLETP